MNFQNLTVIINTSAENYIMKEIVIVKLVLSVLFVICLANMPYGYYQFVRFVGMLGFVYLAYKAQESEQNIWAIFYFSSVILINPIFKISLGRELWNIVDVIWAIILVGTLFTSNNSNK